MLQIKIWTQIWVQHAAAAKSLQSCPTLCDPINGSPPGSPIPGILQARVLEWGAIAFSEYNTIYLYSNAYLLTLKQWFLYALQLKLFIKSNRSTTVEKRL